ncbi:MAG: LysM peptidoglycan-binding domain-containing protein [Paludibacteraceae bacterium]|nr:LysM peptidoglycan-binding domain-containing protein [Paludibacteraceae bacterium]
MKKLLLLFICAIFSIPCMTVNAQVKGKKSPAKRPAVSRAQLAITHDTLPDPVTLSDSIIFEATKHMGKPYRSGNKGPNAFDCSGFTSYVFKQLGFNLGTNSRDQYQQGIKVSKDHIHKGDLVFFTGRDAHAGVGHVGIVYDVAPDNKSFRFIHSSSSKGVSIARYPDGGYYSKRFRGAKRMVDVVSPAPLPIDNTFYNIAPPPSAINLEGADSEGTLETPEADKTHIVKKGENIYSIAKKYHCTAGQLQKWNNLRKGVQLRIGQKLTIKSSEIKTPEKIKEALVKAEEERLSNVSNEFITVKEGENIYSISQKYHCTVKEIDTWNNLKGNDLKAGQELVIRPTSSTVVKDTIENGEVIHTVAKGENIYQIARKYNCQPLEIKHWNNLSNNTLQPGKRLIIKRADKKGVHTVREGETVESLAIKYGVTVEELVEWNHLTHKEIRAGRIIKISSDATSIYNSDDTVKVIPTIPNPNGPAATEQVAENENSETGTAPAPEQNDGDVIYVVKGGDTFRKIAAKYGVTTGEIMEWNHLKNYTLRPNTKLIVKKGNKKTTPKKDISTEKKPSTTTTATEKEQPNMAVDGVYTVKNGDNLYNISRRHHCTVKQLMEWNNLKNDKLRLNQKLIIKQ